MSIISAVILFIILVVVFGLALSNSAKEVRERSIRKKYGAGDLASSLIKGEIHIGMPWYQLIDAWGEPESKEISISAKGTRETWLYGKAGRLYLARVYLENGYITGWKQRR